MYLILSAALLFLHDLCHEIAHLFCCTFLHLPCDVGVGAQCEACIKVTEHARYRFYVYAVLERQGCEVPSRFMRKIVCRLRLSEVSRQ